MPVLPGLVLLMCLSFGRGADAQSTLSGRVLDPSGAVVPRALVNLDSATDERHESTNERGEFRFADIPAGLYDIEVHAANFRERIVAGIHVGPGESAPVTVTLDVGSSGDGCLDSFGNATYDIAKTSGMSGTVRFGHYTRVSPANEPVRYTISTGIVRGAKVTLARENNEGRPLSTKTNAKGEFSFRKLRPGLYRVTVSRAGYETFNAWHVWIRIARGLRVTVGMSDNYPFVCM